MRFSPKVPKLSKSEIIVQLVDSYLNPVLSQQSRLKLEIASVNSSGFSSLDITDNKDGSYSCSYMAKDVGTYKICASFDGKSFLSCPLSINVYSSKFKEHSPYIFILVIILVSMLLILLRYICVIIIISLYADILLLIMGPFPHTFHYLTSFQTK